jgi:N-6 DNA Methylase
MTRRRVASFEHGVKLADNKRGFLDLFWKGKLLVEQKSAGRALAPARKQALDYFPGLKDIDLPRYILLSDFQNFELYDLEIEPDKPVQFRLKDLADHVQSFGFIVGQERRIFRDQDPVNIQASEMMGALHDALENSGYTGHKLERFLVRLLFCLFADDTGIFQPLGLFEDFIKHRTSEDGRDVGARLEELFQVLDTPEDQRQKNLDADLAKFPYINGDLFNEALKITAFDRDMRDKLLNVCGFKWEAISPAIFGSLFQSVMDKKERRKKGAHYTSEKNILKVIEPLFMDDLRAEFGRVKSRSGAARVKALNEFQAKLASLSFFDPACGCGNFLVIAYRELRELELDVIRELHPVDQFVTDIDLFTKVNVNQFYGVEIEEFPARIAEVAMWMMDHIMNVRLSATFGESYTRIPLKNSPNIRHGDALEVEWNDVLPASQCSFVFGNPPFIDKHLMSDQQDAAMNRLFPTKGGSLDYVCAWFVKAGAYVRSAVASSFPRIAFVSTNSITQGEQVAQLWPLLFDRYKLEIAFGHRTFEWMSDAKGKAHVHCVIIGLVVRENEPKAKRLFSYEKINAEPNETQHAALLPYLLDATNLGNKHLVIQQKSNPICNIPKIAYGNKPVDDGHLIFTPDEKLQFLSMQPEAEAYFRPMASAHEFLNGQERWCLWLKGIEPSILRKLVHVLARVEKVKAFRLASKKEPTRRAADCAWEFAEVRQPIGSYFVIPRHSSETRVYVPFGFFGPETIVHDSCTCVPDADLADFAVISSLMHMHWMKYVCGRIKSDYRYSNTLVYNTFPWPDSNDKAKDKLRILAQAVLDARANHPGSTLADLYDPDVMPPDLRKAHHALDDAVDKLYRAAPFASDRERVEHLFKLYEGLTADLVTKAAAKPTKPKRKGKAIG